MIEMVFIMYVATCQMTPGGHVNFQLWYIDMIPFCMMMTNIHPLFFFKIYLDIYPAFIEKDHTHNYHHYCSLVLMYGLLYLKKDETLANEKGVSVGKVVGLLCGAYIFEKWR